MDAALQVTLYALQSTPESLSMRVHTWTSRRPQTSCLLGLITRTSPSAEWLKVAEADKLRDGVMISKLGNLCLLPGINHTLWNKNWNEKVAIYAKSRVNTTRNLGNYQKWGGSEIIERQKYMAQFALAEWRFQ